MNRFHRRNLSLITGKHKTRALRRVIALMCLLSLTCCASASISGFVNFAQLLRQDDSFASYMAAHKDVPPSTRYLRYLSFYALSDVQHRVSCFHAILGVVETFALLFPAVLACRRAASDRDLDRFAGASLGRLLILVGYLMASASLVALTVVMTMEQQSLCHSVKPMECVNLTLSKRVLPATLCLLFGNVIAIVACITCTISPRRPRQLWAKQSYQASPTQTPSELPLSSFSHHAATLTLSAKSSSRKSSVSSFSNQTTGGDVVGIPLSIRSPQPAAPQHFHASVHSVTNAMSEYHHQESGRHMHALSFSPAAASSDSLDKQLRQVPSRLSQRSDTTMRSTGKSVHRQLSLSHVRRKSVRKAFEDEDNDAASQGSDAASHRFHSNPSSVFYDAASVADGDDRRTAASELVDCDGLNEVPSSPDEIELLSVATHQAGDKQGQSTIRPTTWSVPAPQSIPTRPLRRGF